MAMGLSCYGDSNVCKDCGVTWLFLTTLDDMREMETSEHRFKNTHRVYPSIPISGFLPHPFPLGIHIFDLYVYVLILCIK